MQLLLEQVAVLNNKRFGKSSEKLGVDNQICFMEDVYKRHRPLPCPPEKQDSNRPDTSRPAACNWGQMLS